MKPPLIALDFDGTLAALRRDPGAARLPERRRALLARLSRQSRVLIVSGRPLSFLRRALAGTGAALAGEHGWEIRGAGAPWRHPRLARRHGEAVALARAARAAIRRWRGALVERKSAAVTVHYRRCPAARRDPMALRRTLAPLLPPGWRLEPGKRVWEFRPADRWGKAAAILLVARRLKTGRILFAGDDATDEEAFRALAGLARTVKVGPGLTAARERVRGPAGLDRLLSGF